MARKAFCTEKDVYMFTLIVTGLGKSYTALCSGEPPVANRMTRAVATWLKKHQKQSFCQMTFRVLPPHSKCCPWALDQMDPWDQPKGLRRFYIWCSRFSTLHLCLEKQKTKLRLVLHAVVCCSVAKLRDSMLAKHGVTSHLHPVEMRLSSGEAKCCLLRTLPVYRCLVCSDWFLRIFLGLSLSVGLHASAKHRGLMQFTLWHCLDCI